MPDMPGQSIAASAAPPAAEIYDRGYRSYDGPRAGITSAMRSVAAVSIQRALGMRRKFRFKIVPILVIVVAYVPAIGFLAMSIILPSELAEETVAEYAGYFGLIGLAIMLLAAFVGPELLSTDRQTGMFGLYLASPLRRVHYLVAKAVSLILVMMMVTLLPVVFLMAGYMLLSIGPDGFGDVMKTLGQIVLSGSVLALFFTLVGMAGATVTNRQGFASAGIVMVLVGSGIVSGVLVEIGDAPRWVELFNLPTLPLALIGGIFDSDEVRLEDVSMVTAVGVYTAVCLLCALIIGWGYRRMQVTK